ncbi:MAG: hypothetical protein JWQ60_1809 [Pseudonocardia sp.]|nr:hypothetical protein [Pseudonocardia sp.]
MHPNTRRVLRTAPLAVVLALSVGACASPWASGSNSTSTSSTTANKAANSADAPAVPVAAPAGNTPAGLRNDVALLAIDYRALADGSRTLPQVDTDVHTSFARVMDYRNLICLTEEERQKQAGN